MPLMGVGSLAVLESMAKFSIEETLCNGDGDSDGDVVKWSIVVN